LSGFGPLEKEIKKPLGSGGEKPDVKIIGPKWFGHPLRKEPTTFKEKKGKGQGGDRTRMTGKTKNIKQFFNRSKENSDVKVLIYRYQKKEWVYLCWGGKRGETGGELEPETSERRGFVVRTFGEGLWGNVGGEQHILNRKAVEGEKGTPVKQGTTPSRSNQGNGRNGKKKG